MEYFTVLLTSCLTGLESAVWQLTIFVFICKTDKSKPVKQEVNGTVILPPLAFPGRTLASSSQGQWFKSTAAKTFSSTNKLECFTLPK
jgi:hypothetical protein